VAQRLHDELQNRIVMHSLSLQMAADDDSVPKELREQLEQLQRDANDLATVLRSIAYDIMPAPLIERGLRAALEDLCDRVPVAVRLRYDRDEAKRLPESVETVAYFAAAEAVTNALKHAQASTLAIQVVEGSGTFQVTVRDNGIGGASAAGGLGLAATTDRVRALGGDLTIRSSPGIGTEVRVELPAARIDQDSRSTTMVSPPSIEVSPTTQ
jgi:signal transduction histidine kinase